MFHSRRVPAPMRGACCTCALATALLGLGRGAAARTWHVSPTGGGDAPTIQAGIDSAQAGDEVVLAPGTYTWTAQGATGPTMLRLAPGITLRGESGAAATVLDAESNGRLLSCADVGNQAVIADLTFLDGLAPVDAPVAATARAGKPTGIASPNDSHGGAIDVSGASQPAIRRCVFRNNRANGGDASGGAILCGVATIEDCEFIENQAGMQGQTNGRGGAIRCAEATIRRCTFHGNSSWGWEAASGGAIRSTAATITDCVFEENHVRCPGGPAGGAIAALGTPTISHCTFRGNHVDAHYFYGFGGAVDAGSGIVTDCTFIGNIAACGWAAGQGGGLAGDQLTVARCTFVDNTAVQTEPNGPGLGGAIYTRFAASVENCTLIGNSGGTPDGVGGLALMEGGTVSATVVTATSIGSVCLGDPTWSCSDLFGNPAGDAISGTDGGGNFHADPLFCGDPHLAGDVSIRSDSPCAAANHPGVASCTLIGSGSIGCQVQAVEPRTWAAMKLLYRSGAPAAPAPPAAPAGKSR